MQFLNDPEDREWLREVHLPPNAPAFGSFILYGNEDMPDRVELYPATDPLHADKPVAVYVYRSDGTVQDVMTRIA